MTVDNFARHRLVSDEIDLAFIPYWYLTREEGRRLVREHIRPKRIIAVHIPPSELEEQTRAIRAHFPDVVIFAKPLQKEDF